MSELKYKEGDKVRIKSIDWYNKNKSKTGFISFNDVNFIPEMSRYCGEILTINRVVEVFGQYLMSECGFLWTDEMIENLVERNGKAYPYKIGDRVLLKGNNQCATITDLKCNSWGDLLYYIKIDNDRFSINYPTDLLLPYDNMFEGGLMEEETKSKYEDEKNGEAKPKYEDEVNGEYYSTTKYLVRPSGYQFVDENGNVINATKIILEKKKKEYPKTYEECLSVLGIYNGLPDVEIYNAKPSECKLFESFIRLKRCRDAYWKLYGEEMGLDKPWEPSKDKMVYSIYRHSNEIETDFFSGESVTFEFPTAEMRDFFKENFGTDLEICKELL